MKRMILTVLILVTFGSVAEGACRRPLKALRERRQHVEQRTPLKAIAQAPKLCVNGKCPR